MAFVGQVSALFTASTSGLIQGIEKVKKSLGSVGSSLKTGSAGTTLDNLTAQFGKLPFGIGNTLTSLKSLSTGFSALGSIGGAAAGGMGGFASSLAALGGPFTAVVGGAAAAAAAIYAIGAALGSIAGDVERTGQLADQLGVSFTAMQTFGLAATYAGGSTEQFAGALRKFQIGLKEAEKGSSKQAAALRTLGLSQQELSAMSPDEALKKTAEALSALPAGAERTAAAFALFGKSGLQVLTMASALDQAKQDMTRLGVAFSAVDVERFGALDDSFDRLGAATGALGRTLLKPFVELFDYTANGFAEFFGGITAVLDPIADLIAPIGGVIGLVVEVLGKGLGVLGRAIGLVLAPLGMLGTVATKAVRLLSDGFEVLFGAINGAFDAVQNLLGSIPFIGDYFKTNKSSIEAGTDAVDEMASATDNASKEATKLGDKWRSEISKALSTPLTDYQDKLAEIAKSDLSPADAIKAADVAVSQFVKDLDIKVVADDTPLGKFNAAMAKSNSQMDSLSKVTATSAAQEKMLADARVAAAKSQDDAVKQLVSDLGIKIEADPTPLQKYQQQIDALSKITATSAEQEKTLGAARVASTKALLDSLPDAAKIQSPFEALNEKLSKLDEASRALNPVDDAAAIQEIEKRKARLRQEYVGKELGSEQSRKADREKQLRELEQMEKQFAGDTTALAGIREKRAKIEEEIAKIGEEALKQITADNERINKLLGKAGPDKELGSDIEAIDRERKRAQAAFDDAVSTGNSAAAAAAVSRMKELKGAEKAAKEASRTRELDAAGIGNLIKPAVDSMKQQFETLQTFRTKGKISEGEYQQGLANLFEDQIKMQKEINRELSTRSTESLKVSDIRSGDAISQLIGFTTGREDPAVGQRREQLDKLASIETLLRQNGQQPVKILGRG